MKYWPLLLLAALLPLACDSTSPTDTTNPPGQPPPVEPPPVTPPPEPVEPANYFTVAWSEARGEAVFGGLSGVAAFDPTTSSTRIVSSESAGGIAIMVSDPENSAYFVAARPGEDSNVAPSHLWRVNLDSGERTLLVENVVTARVAPEASRALLTVKRAAADPDSLFLLDLATGMQRYLREGRSDSISPDGRHALVGSVTSDSYSLLNVDTGNEMAVPPLAADARRAGDIQWVSGRPISVAHSSTAQGSAHDGRIMEVDLLTGAETLLWEGRGFLQTFYAWRADQHTALLTTFICRPTPFGECVFGSTSQRIVTDGEDTTFGEDILGPTTLSSDGQWLIGTSYSEAQGDTPVAYRVSELD